MEQGESQDLAEFEGSIDRAENIGFRIVRSREGGRCGWLSINGSSGRVTALSSAWTFKDLIGSLAGIDSEHSRWKEVFFVHTNRS